MRLSTLIGLAALLFAPLVGCHRNAEKALASPGVAGTPNIIKEIADHPGSPWKAWRLRAYHITQVWAGADPAVRAKIAVWDDGAENPDTPIAEFYFHDKNPPANPDPAASATPRPYQIHFPVTVQGPVMSVLRNANESVYLYYYEKQWAVGVVSGEIVGVD